jgi:SRSO17 transposase
MADQTEAGKASRFSKYIEGLKSVIGHPRRAERLRDYCAGLLLSGGRRSVEPMAALTATTRERVPAQHQSLLHFVGEGSWSDEQVLAKVREMVQPEIERHGSIKAWIIDDTSFPKQGQHSVGVARQYCGQLGKKANCQVAVSLSIANHYASFPVAYRLYLPQEWAADAARRSKVGVPEEIEFQTKIEIARGQLRWACKAGLPRGVGLMDAAYGSSSQLRAEMTELGLTYVVGILPSITVRPPDSDLLRAKAWSGLGISAKRMRSDGSPRVVSVKEVALALRKRAWRKIIWREGTNTKLSSRFARLRVRVTRRDEPLTASRLEEWLLMEWPEGAAEPTRYWLSTLPADIGFGSLVDFAKLRWRIERDYQELKQEVGLGHFEGRGWRGFHHHATLCIAAYGFLISERGTIPPCGPASAGRVAQLTVPENYRPRGSAVSAATPRPRLDRHRAPPDHRSSPQGTAATLSMLRGSHHDSMEAEKCLTQ